MLSALIPICPYFDQSLTAILCPSHTLSTNIERHRTIKLGQLMHLGRGGCLDQKGSRSYLSTERPRTITTGQLMNLGWKLCCDPKEGIFGNIHSKIVIGPYLSNQSWLANIDWYPSRIQCLVHKLETDGRSMW